VPSHRSDAAPLTRAEALRRERQATRSTPQQSQSKPQKSQSKPRKSQHSGRRATHGARGSSLSVQQAGIAGALGLATIAAPIFGLMSVPVAAKASLNEIPAAPVMAAQFPYVPPSPNAVEALSLVPADQDVPVVPKALVAPRDLLVTDPSRSKERPVLPGCSGKFPLIKADNGMMPNSMLCNLWDGQHQLRADAAISFAKLNVAYQQAFGHSICVSDAYRNLSQQYAVKRERGGLAATPGTSVHGLGRAVDLCDAMQNGTTTYRWLTDNAPRYGWTNPDWALPGGDGPHEPWHWEFHAQTGTDEELLPGE
jgi:LAS superfamily LD-carboxypeptidase LdcB